MVYRSNDENFRAITSGLPKLASTLTQVAVAEDVARAVAGAAPAAAFGPCENALQSSISAGAFLFALTTRNVFE